MLTVGQLQIHVWQTKTIIKLNVDNQGQLRYTDPTLKNQEETQMANYVAIAKGQAAYEGVAVNAGSGRVLTETQFEVVVELKSPEGRVVIAKLEKGTGQWTVA